MALSKKAALGYALEAWRKRMEAEHNKPAAEIESMEAEQYRDCLAAHTAKKFSRKPKGKKLEFGEEVRMTQDEYDKLIAEYGIGDTQSAIRIMSNYKLTHGRKYASDYRAILTWGMKEARKRHPWHGTFDKNTSAMDATF